MHRKNLRERSSLQVDTIDKGVRSKACYIKNLIISSRPLYAYCIVTEGREVCSPGVPLVAPRLWPCPFSLMSSPVTLPLKNPLTADVYCRQTSLHWRAANLRTTSHVACQWANHPSSSQTDTISTTKKKRRQTRIERPKTTAVRRSVYSFGHHSWDRHSVLSGILNWGQWGGGVRRQLLLPYRQL